MIRISPSAANWVSTPNATPSPPGQLGDSEKAGEAGARADALASTHGILHVAPATGHEHQPYQQSHQEQGDVAVAVEPLNDQDDTFSGRVRRLPGFRLSGVLAARFPDMASRARNAGLIDLRTRAWIISGVGDSSLPIGLISTGLGGEHRHAVPIENAVAGDAGDPVARRDDPGQVERIGGAQRDQPAAAVQAPNDRSWPTASGRANCSPDMPATKRPPRISPRASRRR